MQISTLPRPMTPRVLNQAPKPPQEEPPQEPNDKVSRSIVDNLKIGAAAAVCGGVGYAGSIAHNLPYVGPAVSGVAGAVVGASAGAALAAVLPGEKVKAGAFLGLVGGAILGASAGGTLPANILMGVAGATMPVGLLIAVFSGVE